MKKHWKTIDRDIDILITHSPSYGILDLAWGKYQNFDVCKTCGKTHPSYSHWGDFYLGQEILSIKPKVHVFGHVHDQPGFEINSEILRINSAKLEFFFSFFFKI